MKDIMKMVWFMFVLSLTYTLIMGLFNQGYADGRIGQLQYQHKQMCTQLSYGVEYAPELHAWGC